MEEKFEQLIQGLIDHQFGMVDDFISPALVILLRERLLKNFNEGKMQKAGVGNHTAFQENDAVRRDQISWIEDDHTNQGEEEYFRLMWQFMAYLNDTCYTGLNAFECHYARFDTGSFYKRHRDQFQSDSGRKYSIVLYLNDQWTNEDEGKLVLFQKNEEVEVSPLGGRVVFFESDSVDHAVLAAGRPRMSIAGWMKRIHAT
jgi:SM-20-related protein